MQIEKYGDDWETIFRNIKIHENRRRCNCWELPIARRMENEFENDDNFLCKKKNRKVFSDKHPDKWIPCIAGLLVIDRTQKFSQ
jgi:kynurenine 3-monooxygenase